MKASNDVQSYASISSGLRSLDDLGIPYEMRGDSIWIKGTAPIYCAVGLHYFINGYMLGKTHGYNRASNGEPL